MKTPKVKRKAKKRDYHVVPLPDGRWGVRREGNKRLTSRQSRKVDAVYIARIYASQHKCEVVIHNRDGTIRDSDSYGIEGRAKDRKH